MFYLKQICCTNKIGEARLRNVEYDRDRKTISIESRQGKRKRIHTSKSFPFQKIKKTMLLTILYSLNKFSFVTRNFCLLNLNFNLVKAFIIIIIHDGTTYATKRKRVEIRAIAYNSTSAFRNTFVF